VELGLDWAMQSGLENNEDTPYQGSDEACKKKVSVVQDMGELDTDGRIMTSPEWQAKQATKLRSLQESRANGEEVSDGRSFGLSGFTTLELNKEEPLIRAIVDYGPVAIAVAASAWFPYSGGVFDSCGSKNFVVNHAVSLFGYGAASTSKGDQKYWLIRNSWGMRWGEAGFIRMQRTDDEENHCGIDDKPSEGVACDGAPAKVTVCGTCGMLYDSVVPFFNAVSKAPSSQVTPRAHDHGGDDGGGGDSSGGDNSGGGEEVSADPRPQRPKVDFPILVEEGSQRRSALSASVDTEGRIIQEGWSKPRKQVRAIVRKESSP